MITLVAALLLAAAPAAKGPTKWVTSKAKIQQMVNISWSVRHHEGKDQMDEASDAHLAPRLAPPIPGDWPPTGKGYIVYAFAAGPRPALHVGEDVAAPWARALGDGTREKVEDLGPLRRLGMQGVRPLAAPQTEIAHTAEAAEQLVVSLATGKSAPAKPAPIVQRYYCQWAFLNAVAAAELQRLHPAFWKWLSCP